MHSLFCFVGDSSGLSHPSCHRPGRSARAQAHTHPDGDAVHAETSGFSLCPFEQLNFSEANICKQGCFQRRERFQGRNIKIDRSRWKAGRRIHAGLTKAEVRVSEQPLVFRQRSGAKTADKCRAQRLCHRFPIPDGATGPGEGPWGSVGGTARRQKLSPDISNQLAAFRSYI